MSSRGGGGNNGGVHGIPAASRKMVQSLKEIVNGVSEAEIYSALKDCNMDPNEAVNRLLSQDPFHEVKSKREKKKEFKDTNESRPRGGGSTSSRGGRSGTDRYAGRGGSSQFSSSEYGGLNGKSKRENGTSSYTSSSTPVYGVAATDTKRAPPTFSSYENKARTFNVADNTTTAVSSGYQSAWSGVPGQKSMADIVKMGRPQNTTYNTPQMHQEHDAGADHYVSPDDDWPVIEQPQTVDVQSSLDPNVDSENVGRSNTGSQTDDAQAEDENVFEDHTATVFDNDVYKNMHSFHSEDHAFEHKEVEEGDDDSPSSVSASMQQLNIQEERHLDEPEEDVPSVVIPNHLQIQTADCSHLSFGSFSATMNTGFSGSFGSRPLRSKTEDTPVETETSSVGPSETRNSEYYGDESIITSESNPVHQMGPNSGGYDLPSASPTETLKQEISEVTNGNQYSFPSSTPGPAYTFDSSQLLNPSFPQLQNATPFSNVMQAAYTNSLPNTLLAANGHPVRDSDLSYSQFPTNQSMARSSSTSGSTISMAEALKTGVFSSSSSQQTPPGTIIPTGPALPPHLTVHPYSQPTLPLSPFANMIGYPFLPQSYTYMPSAFQQTFSGNNTYHQQLAAVLPQYKNTVSVSSLPQSAAAFSSGYGSFGNSNAIPGNYQSAGPAGSTLSYDDVLNAHYKDNSQLLSLQQNENSGMWVHGGGSRTMSAMPAGNYYSFQSQNLQPSGFRQSQQQQPSQNYGGAALKNQNYYHAHTGVSQDHHQLQQNHPSRDGSQPQPKPQQQQQSQQQLWQNGY